MTNTDTHQIRMDPPSLPLALDHAQRRVLEDLGAVLGEHGVARAHQATVRLLGLARLDHFHFDMAPYRLVVL